MNPWRRPQHKRACESLAQPHAYTYARQYLNGWRCARHTPAAEKGQPEAAAPAPGWPDQRQSPPGNTPGAHPTGAQPEQEERQ